MKTIRTTRAITRAEAPIRQDEATRRRVARRVRPSWGGGGGDVRFDRISRHITRWSTRAVDAIAALEGARQKPNDSGTSARTAVPPRPPVAISAPPRAATPSLRASGTRAAPPALRPRAGVGRARDRWRRTHARTREAPRRAPRGSAPVPPPAHPNRRARLGRRSSAVQPPRLASCTTRIASATRMRISAPGTRYSSSLGVPLSRPSGS